MFNFLKAYLKNKPTKFLAFKKVLIYQINL